MIRTIEQSDDEGAQESYRAKLLQSHIDWLQKNVAANPKIVQEIIPLIESLKPFDSVTPESQRIEIQVQRGLLRILEKTPNNSEAFQRMKKIMEDVMSPIW